MQKEMKHEEVAEFDISQILPIVMVLVVVGIGGAIGLQVLSQIATSAGWAAGSAPKNATDNAVNGIGVIFSYLPTIGLVIAGAIVLGILIRYLWQGLAGKR